MDSAQVAATAKELMAECGRLRDEIGLLRQILIDNDIDPDPPWSPEGRRWTG